MRAYIIHQRLWEHCERLIQNIVLGRQKSAMTKTKVIGIIESLLLISDWHPRSINFSPEYWAGVGDEERSPLHYDDRTTTTGQNKAFSVRWRDDVLKPAKCSDHVSWMLLGMAKSLAAELGLFADDAGVLNEGAREQGRRVRIRKLLYVYVTNLAVRLGCHSSFPQGIILTGPEPHSSGHPYNNLDFFLDSWLDPGSLIQDSVGHVLPITIFHQTVAPHRPICRYLGAFCALLA